MFVVRIFYILFLIGFCRTESSQRLKSTSSKNESRADECFDHCEESINEKAKEYLPQLKNHSLDTVGLSYEELVIFCPKIFQPNKPCMDKCPPNKKFAVAITFYNYLCIDSFEGFKKYIPCIQTVANRSNDLCSRCKLNESVYHGNGNSSGNEGYEDQCRSLSCFTNCLMPYVGENCGEDSIHFFKNYTYTVSFKLNELAYKMNTGKGYEYPPECQKVIKEFTT